MKFLKDSTYRELQNTISDLRSKLEKTEVDINDKKVVVSSTPSSRRDEVTSTLPFLKKTLNVLQPDFEFEVIPIIRKLVKVNPDMSQAFNDLVKLANTGHKIKFDPNVKPDTVDEMRLYIQEQSKNWHVGSAGIEGIINKMFRQIMVTGAIATEWVPNINLNGIEEIRYLYPERIRFVKEKNNKKYQPYQWIKYKPFNSPHIQDLKKLNPFQFRYIAANGDSDVPYGIPPYIPALDSIKTQKLMNDNIGFLVETFGVLGFLSALIQKPSQEPDESNDAYITRLKAMLSEFKTQIQNGYRDGVSVGFQEDHEFEFHTTAKTAQGVTDLFEQNELQIASALDYDAAFMGRPGSTETMITILFTKMLSQLSNVQNLVKENLEFGYKLALKLAGYEFKYLKVEFNKSTITDDLKYQQSQEIKIRNLRVLYSDGIIGQEQYADEMGYDGPDQPQPRIPIDPDGVIDKENKRKERETKKDESDRKSRDKSKPQGTIRKRNINDIFVN